MAKIPNVPCLYRHKINGNYYGIKKINGKEKDHFLDTCDRKEAERNLKDWIEQLGKLDAEAQKTTLDQLLQKFEKIRLGKSKSTKDAEAGMIKKLKSFWKHGLDIRVADIKPSMLDEWLAEHEQELMNSSYNRYTLFLKQLFEVAVDDRMIVDSPVNRMKQTWKRPQKPVRRVPTQEQFQAIVQSIRAQEQNVEAEESADFIEFMGLAGLGQAEASSITLPDIDREKSRIRIRRKKTGELFFVPIYPHLKAFLEKRCKEITASGEGAQHLFKIKDARKALTNACIRLKLPHFSQRNIRHFTVFRLVQQIENHIE